MIGEDYQEAQVKLDYAGNNVAPLDQFGRIVDHVWVRYGQDPGVVDDYTYTYDRAGNRTSRANVLDTALSQLYEWLWGQSAGRR